MRYGATPDEWAHFDTILGLGADMLPVVSNPKAAVSPNSKMKSLGKTPSIYNGRRQVAGVPDWTAKTATARELAAWSQVEDYGICLQCRTVRALDVDVDASEAAHAVNRFIELWLVENDVDSLPTRRRGNSGKFLRAFMLPGDFAKRRVKVDGGAIEFLATGQQFIAAGTHPSGARYEWDSLTDFPAMTAEQFEALWQALVERFGTGDEVVRDFKQRNAKGGIDTTDATMQYLVDKGLALDFGNEGQAFIDCPWKSNHSCDNGVTQTAYFAAGTRGYDTGNFKCMHDGCSMKTKADFESALGLWDEDVADLKEPDDVADLIGDAPLSVDKPKYKDFNKTRKKYAGHANNVTLALSSATCGYQFKLDTFRDEIMISSVGRDEWRAMDDGDYYTVRLRLESSEAEGHRFDTIAADTLRGAIYDQARRHKYDSALEWLNSLPAWDGVPRIENYLPGYCSAADSDYTRAVGRYIWTTLAGRILVPGVKADMMPVLEGRQGCRKSTSVEAMVPGNDYFTHMDFRDEDSDNARKMRGKLIAEVDELKGIGGRSGDSIKSFLARTHEKWIPKYKEFETTFARRLLIMATTNEKQFLVDPTGHRRMLPVHVDQIDIDGIRRDRDQLWAEGRWLFDMVGIDWSAERLAHQAHSQYSMPDEDMERVVEWLFAPAKVEGLQPFAEWDYLPPVHIIAERVFGTVNRAARGEIGRSTARALEQHGYAHWNANSKRGWKKVGLSNPTKAAQVRMECAWKDDDAHLV